MLDSARNKDHQGPNLNDSEILHFSKNTTNLPVRIVQSALSKQQHPKEYYKKLIKLDYIHHNGLWQPDDSKLVREQFAQHPPLSLQYLAHNHLMKAVGAIKELNLTNTPLLETLFTSISESLHKFTPTQLIITLNALSRLGCNLADINEQVLKHIAICNGHFKEHHVSQLVRIGVIKEEQIPQIKESKLATEAISISQRIIELKSKLAIHSDTASVINIFEQGSLIFHYDIKQKEALKSFVVDCLRQIFKSGVTIPATSLGKLANAIKNFNLSVPAYALRLETVLSANIDQIDLKSLAEISACLTKLNIGNHNLVQLLADKGADLIPYSNDTHSVKQLTCLIARFGFTHNRFFDEALDFFSENLIYYQPLDLALQAQAMPHMNHHNKVALDRAAQMYIAHNVKKHPEAIVPFAETLALSNHLIQPYLYEVRQALKDPDLMLTAKHISILKLIFRYFHQPLPLSA